MAFVVGINARPGGYAPGGLRCRTISESIGGLLRPETWPRYSSGAPAVNVCQSAAAKQTVFREAGNHAAADSLGLPVPAVWVVQQISGRWGNRV
jgi:hypothetical protein